MGEVIAAHLAHGYTRGNPENVRSIVDRFSGRVKHSLIMGVAGNWAMQDPVSAMEWIDGLEDLDTKNEARKGAAFSWLRTDPRKASEWVAALPDDSFKQEAIGILVSSQTMSDPESALIWASTLNDRAKRVHHMSNVLSYWRKRNNSDLRAMIQSIDGVSISESETIEIINQVQQ